MSLGDDGGAAEVDRVPDAVQEAEPTLRDAGVCHTRGYQRRVFLHC